MSLLTKLSRLLFVLTCLVGHSQEIEQVKWSNLDFIISQDSTMMTVMMNGKPLDGKFKLLDDDSQYPTPRYNIAEFVDGKAEGESRYYIDGVLIGINQFVDGRQHGVNIVYDKTGKYIMWKIHYVSGKRHGLTWYRDTGDRYYIMGEEATKEEFEEYERTHNKN